MKRNYSSDSAQKNLYLSWIKMLKVLNVLLICLAATKIMQSESSPQVAGDFLITITWDSNSRDDVDTYVSYNETNLVFFQRKEDGFMSLERDDLGYMNDTYTLPNGTKIEYKDNHEIVTIRRALAGEYVVNCHMYAKRDLTETPVVVKIERVRPYKMFFTKTVVLVNHGDEQTFCRFKIDDKGELIDINEHLPKSLIKTWSARPTPDPRFQGL